MVSREISQFLYKELLRMPGSTTTPGRSGARSNAPVRVAFRFPQSVSARDQTIFAAQYLAYDLPYRRFADVLAHADARLGADVDCYSFIAVDLHHLLLASLLAHAGDRRKRPLPKWGECLFCPYVGSQKADVARQDG